MAVLGPGEHPGNGPQVRERPSAGPAGGPGADVQEGDLLDGARCLEVVHEARVLHQAAVGRVGGARQRLHCFVELGRGDESLLALGFERVLQHAGREQLRLIGGRAAVRILERHDLPLLGEAEPALDRAGGLRGDGAAGGRAPAAHGAAPAMEEGDRHSAFPAQAGEPQLGLGELPVGEEEAAVLVRVGVHDHHLEYAALGTHGAAHQGNLQQVTHDLGRPSQIVDGLEQRHDRERAALDPGGVREQPRLLGQQIDAEDVRHVVRHAQDEAADRFAVEAVPRLVNQPEEIDCLRGFRRRSRPVRTQRASQLALQPGAPFGRRGRRRLARVPGTPQRGYGRVHAW